MFFGGGMIDGFEWGNVSLKFPGFQICKNHITTASAKMALVFDWMFFNPAQENIMILGKK